MSKAILYSKLRANFRYRKITFLWAGTFCGLLFPFLAAGQASSAVMADDQITVLQQSLQEETTRLAQLRESQQATLKTFAEKRRALARELLAVRQEISQLEEENTRLATEARDLNERAAEAGKASWRITAATTDLAEALSIHLAEVPGGAETTSLTIDKKTSSTADSQALPALLEAVEQSLETAEEITVKSVTLRTASGQLEKVRLLSVGHVSAAYQVERDESRVGLALASPLDASGFRWTEALPTEPRESLMTAIKTLGGGASPDSLVRLPLDVTGQMPATKDYRQTGLFLMLAKGRMAMIPLLVIAGIALSLIMERFFVLYLRNPLYSGLLGKTLEVYDMEGKAAAQALVNRRRGVLPRVLGACLSAQADGIESMEDRIQTQLLYELPMLRRFLSGLAILAAVAPLLGLLGTVTGIIRTFEAMQSFGNANPHLLAGGISEALITTATGLVVAIPILLLRGVLSGRSERIIAQTESQAAAMLNRLAQEGRASHD